LNPIPLSGSCEIGKAAGKHHLCMHVYVFTMPVKAFFLVVEESE